MHLKITTIVSSTQKKINKEIKIDTGMQRKKKPFGLIQEAILFVLLSSLKFPSDAAPSSKLQSGNQLSARYLPGRWSSSSKADIALWQLEG